MAAAKKSNRKPLETMIIGAAKEVAKGRKKPQRAFLSRDVVTKIEAQFKNQGRTIQQIPLDLIKLDENIRSNYDQEALQTLASSLKNEGLIQFPTLSLKKTSSGTQLVCRNGHRRILAAKSLGWEKIDCVILPFDSMKEELYHTINANLRENVFYLDIAESYCKASAWGASDHEIAQRVGFNQRTVGWYRRLMELSPRCQKLVRSHPELFNATWAIKLARLGPLPHAAQLEKWMAKMIETGKTFTKEDEAPATDRSEAQAAAPNQLQSLRKRFARKAGFADACHAHEFLCDLSQCGLLSKNLVNRIEREVFGETLMAQLNKAQKSKSLAK